MYSHQISFAEAQVNSSFGSVQCSANKSDHEEKPFRILPDILKENLDMVVIGIAPSAALGYSNHHFSGPGNHFWRCISEVGLVPCQVTCEDDNRMPEFGIGFISFCTRPSKSSTEMSRKDIKAGAAKMVEKIKKYRPKIVVFNGIGIYEAFVGNKNFSMGLQPSKMAGTDSFIFVMPSSSARCAQLPRAEDKIPFFVSLRKLRDHIRGILPHLDENEVVFPNYTEFRVTQPDPRSLLKAERRRKRKIIASNNNDDSASIGPPDLGESMQSDCNGSFASRKSDSEIGNGSKVLSDGSGEKKGRDVDLQAPVLQSSVSPINNTSGMGSIISSSGAHPQGTTAILWQHPMNGYGSHQQQQHIQLQQPQQQQQQQTQQHHLHQTNTNSTGGGLAIIHAGGQSILMPTGPTASTHQHTTTGTATAPGAAGTAAGGGGGGTFLLLDPNSFAIPMPAAAAAGITGSTGATTHAQMQVRPVVFPTSMTATNTGTVAAASDFTTNTSDHNIRPKVTANCKSSETTMTTVNNNNQSNSTESHTTHRAKSTSNMRSGRYNGVANNSGSMSTVKSLLSGISQSIAANRSNNNIMSSSTSQSSITSTSHLNFTAATTNNGGISLSTTLEGGGNNSSIATIGSSNISNNSNRIVNNFNSCSADAALLSQALLLHLRHATEVVPKRISEPRDKWELFMYGIDTGEFTYPAPPQAKRISYVSSLSGMGFDIQDGLENSTRILTVL